jgi:hypothetical protein
MLQRKWVFSRKCLLRYLGIKKSISIQFFNFELNACIQHKEELFIIVVTHCKTCVDCIIWHEKIIRLVHSISD